MSIFKKHPLLLVSMLVIVGINIFSSHIVPIYDGVGFPDEPYRYVTPPAGQKNSALSPSPAQVSVSLSNGTNQSDIGLASKEQGPQVNIYIYRLALKGISASTKANIEAAPKSSSNLKTPVGNIAGNIYNLSAKANIGSLLFNPAKNKGYIDLRLPQDIIPPATMVYRENDTSKWKSLDTQRVGSDVYESSIVGLGDYALVPTRAKSANTQKTKGTIIIVLFIVLVILVAALLVVRKKNKKK
jgi:hypothetical protein